MKLDNDRNEIIDLSNINQDSNKKVEENKRRLKKRNKIRYKVLTIILFLIFLLSSVKIAIWLMEKPLNEKVIKNIEENSEVIEYEPENAEIIEADEKKNSPYWDYIKMNLIDVDLNELKTINNEIVGWIQVPGTNINYPFVQTSNNDYYLTHSFDKSNNGAGWIFMDYRNNREYFGKNTIIYGHNRKDTTMFGSLHKALKKDWFKNTNNHIIKMSSDSYNTLWQIFSVYTIPTTNDYIKTSFGTNSEYQEFLDLIAGRSVHKFNTVVTTNDKVLTLSTCYGPHKKMVVHAKLIKIETK